VKRTITTMLVATVAIGLLVYWVASNTDWADTTLPMPLRGEARTNPFYAAERFVEALDARPTRDRLFATPPPHAVVVLSAWNWNLSAARRTAIQAWVESGGRLVVDSTLVGDDREFERWSHIARRYRPAPKRRADDDVQEKCHRYEEARAGTRVAGSAAAAYSMCGVDRDVPLTSTVPPQWVLRDRSGAQAMRVAVGRGTVTVVNADAFRYLNLLDGDHGAVLAAAAQLRRGDDVHFLSEDDHPSLLALAWHYGAPAVSLAIGLVALMLWRRGVRFGPLAAADVLSRRSLTDQIRGTGQFALRHGGESLHAACMRALDEAARRRINGYAQLPADERAAALAALTGIGRAELTAAADASRSRRPPELRRTIAVLETARRRVIAAQGRTSQWSRSS
jgi:uncharacterized protein DUF4350